MYAVIKTGGKQYRVAADDVLTIEKIPGEAGARVKRLDYFVPVLGKGAEMLTGEREDVIDRLIELMKSKGGLQA